MSVVSFVLSVVAPLLAVVFVVVGVWIIATRGRL